MAGGSFRKALTDRLIESIESHGGLPWQRDGAQLLARPFNPVSGVRFRGGNMLNLLHGAWDRDSDDPRWMTLKQANDVGLRVAKNARGERIEYWDWPAPKPKPEPVVDARGQAPDGADAETAPEADEEVRRRPVPFFAIVFNGRDIVGLPPMSRELPWQPHQLAQKLIEATGVRVRPIDEMPRALARGGRDAFPLYVPGQDEIIVPPPGRIRTQGDYYAHVLQELAHWTGHPSRLNRPVTGAKGEAEYGREELRGAIASMLLQSMLGIEGQNQSHASYVAGWLDALRNDKHEIFRAARDAERIVDFVFEFAPEVKATLDSQVQANVLPRGEKKVRIDRGIAALPSFVPPDVAPPQRRTGREDARWPAFEQALWGEAKKYGIADAAVEKTFELIAPQFTDVLDAAGRNGYSVDDMSGMLMSQLVEDMRANHQRETQWNKFCEQVRVAAEGVLSPERVELELQKLSQRYQLALQRSVQQGWDAKRTDEAIRNVIYGEAGRRPITADYVRQMFMSPASGAAPAAVDADDDLLLAPLGESLALDDAMPLDAAAVGDEPVGVAARRTSEADSAGAQPMSP